MKPWILLILLAVFFLPLQTAAYYGEDTLAAHSGSWYNPDQDGHGFHVEVIDRERTIIYWYTYSREGRPIWLLLDGKNDQVGIDGPIYYCEGMAFGDFDPADNTCQEWGRGRMFFNGCDTASFDWFTTIPGYEHGTTSLVRLTNIATMECNFLTEGLTGEWDVWVVSSGQTEAFQTTVENDGRYYFIDDMGCRWDGQIERTRAGSNELVGETGTTECAAPVPITNTTGLYRTTQYEVCQTPETCGRYAPTMQLVTDWYDTSSGQLRQHLILTRPQEESAGVGKLAGDWLLSFDGSDNWYEITVSDDGTFTFWDALACTWGGTLAWSSEPANYGAVEARLQTTQCNWVVPEIELIGMYVEPYEVCGSGGGCVTHDAAIGLEGVSYTYDSDGNPLSGPNAVKIQIVRPLSP